MTGDAFGFVDPMLSPGMWLALHSGKIIFAVFLNLFIVGYLEPYSHYRFEGLRFDLKSGALGAAIKVGEFKGCPPN